MDYPRLGLVLTILLSACAEDPADPCPNTDIEQPCIGAGGPVDATCDAAPSCCAGLQRIPLLEPATDYPPGHELSPEGPEGCTAPRYTWATEGLSVCTACGDGVCDHGEAGGWESYCNCPADCTPADTNRCVAIAEKADACGLTDFDTDRCSIGGLVVNECKLAATCEELADPTLLEGCFALANDCDDLDSHLQDACKLRTTDRGRQPRCYQGPHLAPFDRLYCGMCPADPTAEGAPCEAEQYALQCYYGDEADPERQGCTCSEGHWSCYSRGE